MKLSVIGCGYVGLVSGACFAKLGNTVTLCDIDQAKIKLLQKGSIPIYEPGLQELVTDGLKRNRIHFTHDLKKAVMASDVIFIAVGTPSKPGGEADLSFIENVARSIGRYARSYKLIVEKSTVPVSTGEKIKATLKSGYSKKAEFDVASNPEFLKEGSAIRDFMSPDRVILGVESARAKKILEDLYEPLRAKILFTNIQSAEIIKHASNSFLATKISFINALSQICDLSGANVDDVAQGMGLDPRIGPKFLNAGIGFGGSCFPKDISAFIKISEELGYNFNLLREVEKVNADQKNYFLKKIKNVLWNLENKTIAVLGLSFKPNTDDMRSAPSLDILTHLLDQGSKIKAYDPHAIKKAKSLLPKSGMYYAKDPYDACRGADCVLVLTEWDEFKELDMMRIRRSMKNALILDGRNLYDPKKIRALGFEYHGIGRPSGKG